MTDLLEREITACTAACPARYAASVVEKRKRKKEKIEEECCNKVEGSHPTAFTVNYGCTRQA